MASSGSFYQLPNELLMKIFSYLDIPDLIRNIQHVDSRCKAIVQHISIWRDKVFTFEEQMTDKEIILFLQDMPALRGMIATRAVSNNVIQTLCQSKKCITRLELHRDQRFIVSDLETIVTNLPKIQHLAFPLHWKENENAMKYSTLIQQLHGLLSLTLLGDFFNARNCFFLTGIASECPLLHEIDLGRHLFYIKDIILFLEAKKQLITKFAGQGRNSVEMIRHLESCKQLQTLYLAYNEETLPDIPLFDLPNLKYLGFTDYEPHNFPTIVRNLQDSTISNLVKLDLGFCYLDHRSFINILKKCAHLKILILEGCFWKYGDNFEYLGNCTDLEYLNVNDTPITDWAVERFAQKCTKLKYLDMSDCQEISDYSLQCLIHCKVLQTLHLNSTQITGKNFHLIPHHLMKLCNLYVKACDNLDVQYVQQLKEQMPHLQIHTSRSS